MTFKKGKMIVFVVQDRDGVIGKRVTARWFVKERWMGRKSPPQRTDASVGRPSYINSELNGGYHMRFAYDRITFVVSRRGPSHAP